MMSRMLVKTISRRRVLFAGGILIRNMDRNKRTNYEELLQYLCIVIWFEFFFSKVNERESTNNVS